MSFVITESPLGPPIKVATRTVSTNGGAQKVTGYNGAPAAGRKILLLGLSEWAQWQVKAETVTDSNGDYSFSISAGPNDKFIVVGIGDPNHDEFTRALGEIVGVI